MHDNFMVWFYSENEQLGSSITEKDTLSKTGIYYIVNIERPCKSH